MADAINRVAKFTERTLDGFDRAELIELSRLQIVIAGGDVVRPQIISKSNVHSWYVSTRSRRETLSDLFNHGVALNWIVVSVLAAFIVSQQQPIAISADYAVGLQ